MRRTGIELSASRCSLVDVEVMARRGRGAPDIRVRNFHTIPLVDGPARLAAELRALVDANKFPRHAWVTLWGVRSTHQFLQMASARRSELQSMARRHAIQSGLASSPDGSDVVSDSVVGGKRRSSDGPKKREVALISASSFEIRERLQPILEAGFKVEGAVTPAEALWAQARLRRGVTPGDVYAYLALSPTASAVTIVRDGLPLFSHELNWGYASEKKGSYPFLSPEADGLNNKKGYDPFFSLAEQLASELRRSFTFAKQHSDRAVTLLLLCGDMPELRSLTAPLIDLLDVEVETLDSLQGIDATVLPEPAEGFREQIAGLRLALAVAAQPPPVNLIPPEQMPPVDTRQYGSLLGKSAAAAALVCGVMYGYASVQASRAAAELDEVNQQMATLAPRVHAADLAQGDERLEPAQWAALTAFETQGPRIARILETVSQAAPPAVTVRSVTVRSDGASWRLMIAGVAETASAGDPARAQATVNDFFQLIQQSPLIGPPVQPPYMKITAPRGGVAGGTEFTVEFLVRK